MPFSAYLKIQLILFIRQYTSLEAFCQSGKFRKTGFCAKKMPFLKKIPAVILQEEENTLYYLRKKVNQTEERFVE